MIVSCVSLRDGTLREMDLEAVQRFSRCGDVVLVDNNAPADRECNAALIERLCAMAQCHIDAAICDVATARMYLRMGAKGIVADAGAAAALLREMPRQRVTVRSSLPNVSTDPAAALVAGCDFEKGGGLLPTVAMDIRNAAPLMLAYSSPESLLRSRETGQATYWSRSRRQLWRKGETSGNTQQLVRVSLDCDRDSAIFWVEQSGPACHTGERSCFERPSFDWHDLYAQLAAKTEASTGSYTASLLRDGALLDAKILEEAQEVAFAPTRSNLAWECADLLYFMTVKMRREGITIEAVMQQLASRVRA
jgi:phosphoribosyl-ATP pyrophosphohydrolase